MTGSKAADAGSALNSAGTGSGSVPATPTARNKRGTPASKSGKKKKIDNSTVDEEDDLEDTPSKRVKTEVDGIKEEKDDKEDNKETGNTGNTGNTNRVTIDIEDDNSDVSQE